MFILYLEVTNTPPTIVTCSVNNNTFSITEEDLYRVPDISTDPIRVAVTSTIRMREAGEYTCTVRTDSSIKSFPATTTPAINISGKLQHQYHNVYDYYDFPVTDTPSNLSYNRTSITSVLLTWSPPIGNIPTVVGYEVFLNLSNGTGVSIETNTTKLTLVSLQPDNNYSAFVVAYGGDLPSDHSNTVVISPGK